MADNMIFMFAWAKTSIGEKDVKTRHKSASDTADKHLRTPGKVSRRPGSAPLPRPGPRGTHTRVSSGFKSCF